MVIEAIGKFVAMSFALLGLIAITGGVFTHSLTYSADTGLSIESSALSQPYASGMGHRTLSAAAVEDQLKF